MSTLESRNIIHTNHILNTIRTQRLEIVDERDKVRITLDGTLDGPVIRLWGNDGELKATLGIQKNGQASFALWNKYMPMVDLRLQEDGDASFILMNKKVYEAVAVQLQEMARLHREKQAQATAAGSPLKKTSKKDGKKKNLH